MELVITTVIAWALMFGRGLTSSHLLNDESAGLWVGVDKAMGELTRRSVAGLLDNEVFSRGRAYHHMDGRRSWHGAYLKETGPRMRPCFG